MESAQKDYDEAVANLNAALAGPDALTVAAKQAALEVAQAEQLLSAMWEIVVAFVDLCRELGLLSAASVAIDGRK